MSGIENGWVASGREPGEHDSAPVKIGMCSCCYSPIYYDEELETYGRTKEGELLCWECFEELSGDGKA